MQRDTGANKASFDVHSPQSSVEARPQQTICGIHRRDWPKVIALVCVVMHQTTAVFTMRYSQTAHQGSEKPRYLSTVTVLMTEVLKLVASMCLVSLDTGGPISAVKSLFDVIAAAPGDILRLLVPGLLYAVQNNLLFVALANLTAAVYTVSYQLKTLATALFSVLILSRELSRVQWLSLLGLSAGVAILQVATDTSHKQSATTAPPGEVLHGPSTSSGQPLVGMAAVLGASLTSGFCGVYMEKLLKQRKVSLWMRNVQLALVGAPMGLLTAMWNDGDKIRSEGFFQGWDTLVLAIVVINALGGLGIAAVLRYADNITKCFASAVAVVVCCLTSIAYGEQTLTLAFLFGSVLVIVATIVYALGIPSKAQLIAYMERMGLLEPPKGHRTEELPSII